MKNVLLIGDSIRAGYDKAVKKSLEGIANVYFPEENCRFASYVLRYIHEYRNLVPHERVDVVHWNAGLWDCLRLLGDDPHTPIEFYKYYVDKICSRIIKVYPEARVIFATSTSVLSHMMPDGFKRYNEEIEAYNEAAVEIVRKYGFDINDLYTASVALPEEAHSDSVHFYTPMGTEIFANLTLKHISSALELKEIPEYSEELHTAAPVGI